MKIVNLTPHSLHVVADDKTVIEIPPSGKVARVSVTRELDHVIDDTDGRRISVYKTRYGRLEGLPRRKAGVVYIVSALVKARTRRDDVLAVGELIRDEQGRVIGCNGLSI